MDKRLRLHAIAITIICVLVTVIYNVAGPKAATSSHTSTSPYVITVVSATWGQNCNAAILEAKREREQAGLPRDAQGNVIPTEPLVLIEKDNALEATKSACNGRPQCQISLNNSTFGFNPLESCYKMFNVSYRCFDIDRLRTKTGEQGMSLNIDCTSKAEDSHASNHAQ